MPGVIGVLTGLLACTALTFAWRRLSGALVIPLSAALLIPSGFLACFAVLGIRLFRRNSFKDNLSSRADLILDIALSAAIMIFAAALSLPGTNGWGLALFWLFIASEELWSWRHRAGRLLWRPWGKKISIRPVRIDPAQSVPPHINPANIAQAPVSNPMTSSTRSADHIIQQLTRSTTADGSDVLSGWLRLDLVPGQRIGSLHVAFCPPFTSTPELTVEQLDGPEARLKIAQLLPYGARLDLKLLSFSEETTSVLVQFSARADK
jgi:hypothetical protein